MRRPHGHRRRLKPSSVPAAGQGVEVPFVAIVGRPNVGKSTLFNRLLGRRVAIVEKTAGTTRDRVSAVLELPNKRRVELCDMGGLGGTDDVHDRDVARQIQAAMRLADAVLFVVDSRDGATNLDRDIANRVLKLAKPVVLVANKAETKELEAMASELYALGAGDPVPISAREGTGRADLLERLARIFPVAPEPEGQDQGDRELRVAVVGRRNAGKSSFVNALFGDERVIVSATPGTTRDAVDVRCIVEGEPVILIDTAGLRKRGKADDQIEVISHGRAMEAVRRADVAIVLLDALRDMSEVDKRICELVVGEHKGLVVVASKWDLVEDRMSLEQFSDYVRKKMPSIDYCPVTAISATTRFGVTAPIRLARELYRQSLVRIGTAQLNRVVHEAFARRRPRKKRHVDPKIYFATQIRTNPVTIVLFVNKPALFDADYRRYIAAELRAVLPWGEIPLKLVVRERRGLLERGLSRAERDRRKLERLQRWLEDEGAVPEEEVAAELDQDEVKAALAAELDEEEGRAKPSSFAESPVEEEAPRGPDPLDLLYGEDAEIVRRQIQRKRKRRR